MTIAVERPKVGGGIFWDGTRVPLGAVGLEEEEVLYITPPGGGKCAPHGHRPVQSNASFLYLRL
jgi:hypothetical protein